MISLSRTQVDDREDSAGLPVDSPPIIDRTRRSPEASASTGERVIRFVLWLGALAPLLAPMPRTGSEIQQVLATTPGALDFIRGMVPLMAVLLAAAFPPAGQKNWGLAEVGLAAFLAWALLSTFWSINPQASFLKALLLSVSYLNLWQLVKRYSSADEAVNALVGFVYCLLLSTSLQLLLFPGLSFQAASQGASRRAYSLFPSIGPNTLAFVAAVGLLALVFRLGPGWSRRSFRLLLFMDFALVLIATRTRAALAVGLILIGFAAISKARTSFAAGTVACLVLSAAVPAIYLARQQLEVFLVRGQSADQLATLTGRTDVWGTAIRVWRDEPWTGSGFYAGHRIGLVDLGRTPQNLDNVWIEVLLNLGIIGAGFLALFLFAGLYRLVAKWSSKDRLTRSFCVLVVIYGVITSFFNPSLQANNATQVLLAFTLLCGVKCVHSHPLPRSRLRSNPI